MATELYVVTGDQYRVIDRRMREIKRQLDQKNGSPLDPEQVAADLQQILEGSCCSQQVQPSLLARITTVQAQGTKKFIADEKALETAHIGWANDNLEAQFLGLEENDVSDAGIAIHRLECNSKDALILAELGEKAQIKLAHFFSLLKAQSKGEEGPLLVNGCANIAYIIGKDGNLWAVHAYWNSGHRYWHVHAHSVENPSGRDAGYQVLSRDS